MSLPREPPRVSAGFRFFDTAPTFPTFAMMKDKGLYCRYLPPLLTGIVAFGVYLLTLESGVSLWDSPEFVAAAARLQIGHPPGAPLYLLLARLASLFAPTPHDIPFATNLLSALCSAAAVAFLADIIRRLAKRLVPSLKAPFPLLRAVAAVIGALSFAFTDTFWHSALETEVYALSSLFTLLVFWTMLRWEEALHDAPAHASRWLLLTVYLLGLSLGVHFLTLLSIPPIVLLYYFARYSFRWRSFFLALLVGIGVLAAILYCFLPGVLLALRGAEAIIYCLLAFPRNVGATVGLFALFFLLALGAWLTFRRSSPRLHLLFLCIALLLLGYSSYTLVVLRASAHPPLNLGAPAELDSLKAYLAREQYGAPPRYPRIYSQEPEHQRLYAFWANGLQDPPSLADNLRYTVAYQLNHQYWRYFLWNFLGRQDDVLNTTASTLHGNALSGIRPFDALFLGDQSQLTPTMRRAVGRQPLYALPLLFGALGIGFLFFRSPRYNTVCLLSFLFMGLAIALYLNDTPLQPRERDYVYVGSFAFFAIPIGLSVFPIYYFFSRVGLKVSIALDSRVRAHQVTPLRTLQTSEVGCGKPFFPLVLTLLLTLPLPLLLLCTNYASHQRHGRHFAQELAHNYLVGLPPQTLLFTEGDNDTYPLWYLQQVEGFRTDVRVCNIGLLSLPWYRAQLRQRIYDAEPLTFPALPDEPLAASEVLFLLMQHAGTRPIYFTSVPRQYIAGIENYLAFEGLTYRFQPHHTPLDSLGRAGAIDPDTLFLRLIGQSDYTTLVDTTRLADFPIRQVVRTIDLRGAFSRLAESLVRRGDSLRARHVIHRSLVVLNGRRFPMDEHTAEDIELLIAMHDYPTADSLTRTFLAEQQALLSFYQSQWVDGRYLASSPYYQRAQRLVERLQRAATSITLRHEHSLATRSRH